MSVNRTYTIAKNSFYSVFCHCATLLVQFVVRTFFIKCLTIEYVGIHGLFTNILIILSLADLGMVNAMNFSLYRPLASNDQYKIGQIMLFFKKIYRIIAIVVFLLGIGLLPFLDFFLSEKPDIPENLNIIYLFFVFNSAVSYLFAYKQTLIIADQRKYIVSVYTFAVNLFICSLQCLLLYLFSSFYSYLILMVVCTVLTNVFISLKCNKDYPVLKEKGVRSIESEERNNIFKNIKSLFLYRVGGVVLNGTSNIIISKYFNIVILGLCSNVYYLINSVNGIILQVLLSFLATLGNVNAIESKDHKIKVFYKTSLFCFWLYGFFCLACVLFLNDFIIIWIGPDYILDKLALFSIAVAFYIDGAGFPLYAYRSTMGLFSTVRYAPLIAAVLNIFLAVVLLKWIGVAGVYFAIAISRFFCINCTDIYVVFKKGLKDRFPYKFLSYYISFVLLLASTYIITVVITHNILINNNYLKLVCDIIIYTLIFHVAFLVYFKRSTTFNELWFGIKSLIKIQYRI